MSLFWQKLYIIKKYVNFNTASFHVEMVHHLISTQGHILWCSIRLLTRQHQIRNGKHRKRQLFQMGKFKHNKPQLLYNLPFFQDIRSEKTALFATTAPMFSCFRYHHFVCQVPQSGCGCQLIFTKTLFLMDTMCEKTKIVYQFVFSDLGGPGRSVG